MQNTRGRSDDTVVTKPNAKPTRSPATTARKPATRKTAADKPAPRKPVTRTAAADKPAPRKAAPAAKKATVAKQPAPAKKATATKRAAPATKPAVAKKTAPTRRPRRVAPPRPLIAMVHRGDGRALSYSERLAETMHRHLGHDGPVCHVCRTNASRLAALTPGEHPIAV